MIAPARRYRPFARSGRGMIAAIFITFVLIFALTVTLSIRATNHSRNLAEVVEVISRQRTLAERYVNEVLLVRAGEKADPRLTASVLAQSVHALLWGGTAPAMNGDDDETTVPAAHDPGVHAQLMREQRLVTDLAAFGNALLDHRQLAHVPETAGERIASADSLQRLRILAALTSNVALNSTRTIAAEADGNVSDLVTMQLALGLGGLLLSLLLASALIATTRRQSAHFRALVTSSSDLVLVLGAGGCLYASRSLCKLLGHSETELHGTGFQQFVHEEDLEKLLEVTDGEVPQRMMLRVRNYADELRYLEAHLTDMRRDQKLRGVVISSRDATDRVRLEEELALQTQRDAFDGQLVEALDMADDEQTAFSVVERAMVEIAPDAPIELLLSDSSRSHLNRAVSNPLGGAPGCPVESPFECVAVRRGQAVEFESSEALNACPKLRDRDGGPCSAVCVPVSFMGRALGVLHATLPEEQSFGAERVGQLTNLATHAGARIGTVRAFERTQLQAATDGLTGLVNRRAFERYVRDMIAQERTFALAVADLDRFKTINDTYGHEAGDGALRLFAQVAQDALRDSDLLGRWGGEEFVFLLAGVDAHGALPLLERIRANLSHAHTGGHPRFTASFGVTDSSAGDSLGKLMLIADAGLYTAKRAGRDRITIGDPESESPALTAVPAPDESSPALTPARRHARPLLHEAVDEEEPRPTGFEIR